MFSDILNTARRTKENCVWHKMQISLGI